MRLRTLSCACYTSGCLCGLNVYDLHCPRSCCCYLTRHADTLSQILARDTAAALRLHEQRLQAPCPKSPSHCRVTPQAPTPADELCSHQKSISTSPSARSVPPCTPTQPPPYIPSHRCATPQRPPPSPDGILNVGTHICSVSPDTPHRTASAWLALPVTPPPHATPRSPLARHPQPWRCQSAERLGWRGVAPRARRLSDIESAQRQSGGKHRERHDSSKTHTIKIET